MSSDKSAGSSARYLYAWMWGPIWGVLWPFLRRGAIGWVGTLWWVSSAGSSAEAMVVVAGEKVRWVECEAGGRGRA